MTDAVGAQQDSFEWFLDGDRLAERDEEYRARNAMFRRKMLECLDGAQAHPLRFLVSTLGRWYRSSARGTTWDAGHIVPVAQLKKMGATHERLAVQDRRLNRSSGARRIKDVVDVAGVPVDLKTLEHWAVAHPHLRRFTTARYLRTHRVRGWSARTKKMLRELELELEPDVLFVVAGQGKPWVRRIGT